MHTGHAEQRRAAIGVDLEFGGHSVEGVFPASPTGTADLQPLLFRIWRYHPMREG